MQVLQVCEDLLGMLVLHDHSSLLTFLLTAATLVAAMGPMIQLALLLRVPWLLDHFGSVIFLKIPANTGFSHSLPWCCSKSTTCLLAVAPPALGLGAGESAASTV